MAGAAARPQVAPPVVPVLAAVAGLPGREGQPAAAGRQEAEVPEPQVPVGRAGLPAAEVPALALAVWLWLRCPAEAVVRRRSRSWRGQRT